MRAVAQMTFAALAVLAACDERACKLDEHTSMMQMQQVQKPPSLAKKLHILSMGRSGSCFWGDLFANKGNRPYIFEPFNGKSWGLWHEAFQNKNHVDMAVLDTEAEEKALRKLKCLYECQGCEGQVTEKFQERVQRFCHGDQDRGVIKTVALLNASTLLRVPMEHLKEQKFVLMLRDPRSMEVYTEDIRCKRELELALTIKDFAQAVGTQNVRTVFYERWTRDLPNAVQDVADWAEMKVTEEMKSAMKPSKGDSASQWLQDAPRGTMERAEKSRWCGHLFKLIGYPSKAEISKVPETATWEQLRDALPYDQLKDPAQSPMTAEERQILEDMRKEGSSNAW